MGLVTAGSISRAIGHHNLNRQIIPKNLSILLEQKRVLLNKILYEEFESSVWVKMTLDGQLV